jgi:hypothetical protein
MLAIASFIIHDVSLASLGHLAEMAVQMPSAFAIRKRYATSGNPSQSNSRVTSNTFRIPPADEPKMTIEIARYVPWRRFRRLW